MAPFAPFGEHAGRLGLTLGQAIVVGAMAMTLGLALRASTAVTLTNIVFWAQVGFLVCAAWRIALIFAMQRGGPTTAADPEIWPRYTVLVALHDEASIMDQIVDRLSRIDYPADVWKASSCWSAMTPRPLPARSAWSVPTGSRS